MKHISHELDSQLPCLAKGSVSGLCEHAKADVS